MVIIILKQVPLVGRHSRTNPSFDPTLLTKESYYYDEKIQDVVNEQCKISLFLKYSLLPVIERLEVLKNSVKAYSCLPLTS